jgi:hypothetical protein
VSSEECYRDQDANDGKISIKSIPAPPNGGKYWDRYWANSWWSDI